MNVLITYVIKTIVVYSSAITVLILVSGGFMVASMVEAHSSCGNIVEDILCR